jgi:hypothetical protein
MICIFILVLYTYCLYILSLFIRREKSNRKYLGSPALRAAIGWGEAPITFGKVPCCRPTIQESLGIMHMNSELYTLAHFWLSDSRYTRAKIPAAHDSWRSRWAGTKKHTARNVVPRWPGQLLIRSAA